MKTLTVRTRHNGKSQSYSVYGSEKSFIRHCRKHILNRNDCWSKLLDEDLFDKALRRLKGVTSRNAGGILSKGVFARLYDEVYTVVKKEIEESADSPRYACYEICEENGNVKPEMLFLSSIGMIMPCAYGIIPTAYIKSRPEESKITWALKSWEGAVRILRKKESCTVNGINWVNEKNWSKAPLPPGEATYFGKLVEKALAAKVSKAEAKNEEES